MPRGDKSKYTDKQERKADHIAESYEDRGVSEKEAERRAWATVNKDDGGGKKAGGAGQGKRTGHPAAHKGGEKGGKACCGAHRRRAFNVGEEGGGDPQAQCRPSRAPLGSLLGGRQLPSGNRLRAISIQYEIKRRNNPWITAITYD